MAVPSLPWSNVRLMVVVVPARAWGGSMSMWPQAGAARATTTPAAKRKAGRRAARSRDAPVHNGGGRSRSRHGSPVRWAGGSRPLDGPSDLRLARHHRRFRGFNDAGEAASTAARYLLERWEADLVASIDPEEFFDFTSTRPHVQLDDDGQRQIVWPATDLYAVPNDGAGVSVAVLLGPEPDLRWRTYCRQVTDVATAIGARLVVRSARSLPRCPIPSCAGHRHSSRPRRGRRTRPAGLHLRGPDRHRGCAPRRLPRGRHCFGVVVGDGAVVRPGRCFPQGHACAGRAHAALLGRWVPTTELEIATAAYERQVDELVQADQETADYVASLERRHDDESDPFPSGASLVEEVGASCGMGPSSSPRLGSGRMEPTGKVAVVTGAASGIGLALAQRFASGGDVGRARRHRSRPAQRRSKVDRCGRRRGACRPTDVRDPNALDALAAAAVERFGAAHVLCNNAGVAGGRIGLGHRSGALALVVDVNLLGVANGIRAFVPHMISQGEGHVVNTASAAGLITGPGMSPYFATKHAVVALSESLHYDLKMSGHPSASRCSAPSGYARGSASPTATNLPGYLPRRKTRPPPSCGTW